jgi:hypothetical protein
MDWIWRVQNDDSETDLSVLWTHLSGGDDWHRRRFQQAWLNYSGLETRAAGALRGIMAGSEAFAEGVTFGWYQAPDWARETAGFEIARGIGTANVVVEGTLASAGLAVGFGTSVGTAGGMLGESITSLLPGAAVGTAATSVPQIQQAVQRGKIVLGHYPEYIEKARELDARIFNIPSHIWSRMSDVERWAANQKFLDRAIARGDDVILATNAAAARAGSWFARELEYLATKGYRVAEDGMKMIAPRR